MAQKIMTPGVYIEEVNTFPGSVLEVPTAIPAFIGYTEKASRNGKSLANTPARITSLKEYEELFGNTFDPKFTLELLSPEEGVEHKHEMTIGEKILKIAFEPNNELFFYNSLRLFYANGGGTCYIVSVGLFEKTKGAKIDADALLVGLKTLEKEQEPTIIIIPEAVKLGLECYDVYKQVLMHCGKIQSRVAILDIFDGDKAKFSDHLDPKVNVFRDSIGTECLDYGAAYYPWLNTSIVSDKEITFLNFDTTDNLDGLMGLISEEDAKKIIEEFPKGEAAFKTAFSEDKPEIEDDKIAEQLPEYIQNKKQNLHLGLLATSPTYKNILDKLREVANLLPPSSAMAGVYNAVDNSRGVWKSPANISLNAVINPVTNITHDDQKNLNVDAISGKSINAIRTFPGIGLLVWGGRTLDGNSLDWRYINVRRTMIMLEQSIKLALSAYVFEPNDANTWVTIKSMIVNFLTEKWKQGALAGSSPEDAFDVQIGLGATMTGVDILEGKMMVSVKLAIVRPAEFIVVTFEQQMQKS